MAKEQLQNFSNFNIKSATMPDSTNDLSMAINKIRPQNEDGKEILNEMSAIENLVKDLVKRKHNLKTVQKFLKNRNFKKEYGIKKTPNIETIKTIFNDANEEAREESQKALLQFFVKISTYSEELKPDKLENGKEDRGTEMGEPPYYKTKNSNKTWAAASSILQDFLEQKIITDQDFVKHCEQFIETANTKYLLSTIEDYPSKNTTSEQLTAIKTIINIVIAHLIKYGGKNIVVECETILNNLDKQKGDLEKTLFLSQDIDEKINKKNIFAEEVIQNIDQTKKFLQAQLKSNKLARENL